MEQRRGHRKAGFLMINYSKSEINSQKSCERPIVGSFFEAGNILEVEIRSGADGVERCTVQLTPRTRWSYELKPLRGSIE